MSEKGAFVYPGWEIVDQIGEGSFGNVYEIKRDLFGETERAALKVISIPKNLSDLDDLYNDGYDKESITNTFKEHLKQIVAEYTLMRKMNGSANVVNCDDVQYIQHEDGIGWDIFIKMELLTPLNKALPETVSVETVVRIAKDMCSALELCKKYGIVHRDIKPQNILVSPNGDYKLGDFGIAKTVEKTMGGTKAGTYRYMAPEVYHSRPYGSSVDIYSLGLVLYWLLNERRMPFMPLPPERLTASIENNSRDRRLCGECLPAPKHGSEALKAIVLKACAFNPEDRYQSPEEMKRALESLEKKAPKIAAADNIHNDVDDGPETVRIWSGKGKNSGTEESHTVIDKGGNTTHKKNTEFWKNKLFVPVIFAAAVVICAISFAIGLSLRSDDDVLRTAEFQYQIVGESVRIVGLRDKTAVNIEIPDTIEGMAVTAVGEKAFEGCEALQTVTLPNTVTTIGKSAFWGCESLRSIAIPDSVTMIEEAAFVNCTSLAEINIPSSITVISNNTFSGCESLSEVKLPETIERIGDRAFTQCDSLTKFTIPQAVEEIGGYAFYDCPFLTEVYIYAGAETIGEYAFAYCQLLKQINYEGDYRTWSAITIEDNAIHNTSAVIQYNCPAIPGAAGTTVEHTHEWLDATYTDPQICQICGEKSGSSLGFPLTWCSELENTDNPTSKKSDVDVGTWTDCFGGTHENAVKFWVNEYMVDYEYIVYAVNGAYCKMDLTMVNFEKNAAKGENRFTVYADDTLIYRSDWISNSTSAVVETLDITGAQKIKIVCDTDTKNNCYGLAKAILYNTAEDVPVGDVSDNNAPTNGGLDIDPDFDFFATDLSYVIKSHLPIVTYAMTEEARIYGYQNSDLNVLSGSEIEGRSKEKIIITDIDPNTFGVLVKHRSEDGSGWESSWFSLFDIIPLDTVSTHNEVAQQEIMTYVLTGKDTVTRTGRMEQKNNYTVLGEFGKYQVIIYSIYEAQLAGLKIDYKMALINPEALTK